MALSDNAVLDIPEVAIISALEHVVSYHRSQSPARTRDTDNADAMQIDSNIAEASPTDIPTLPDFLSYVISYPTSPAPLRLAIHEHLRDTNDLVSVLNVIEGWMDQWSKAPVQLLPLKKKATSIKSDPEIPPLSKVSVFHSTLGSIIGSNEYVDLPILANSLRRFLPRAATTTINHNRYLIGGPSKNIRASPT